MDPIKLTRDLALSAIEGNSPDQEKHTGGKNASVYNAFGQILKDQLQPVTQAVQAAAQVHTVTPGETLSSFGNMLSHGLSQVNELQDAAGKAARTYATGGPIELHQVAIAGEKAEIAMELTMQIRSKLMAAYQEVSKMGV